METLAQKLLTGHKRHCHSKQYQENQIEWIFALKYTFQKFMKQGRKEPENCNTDKRGKSKRKQKAHMMSTTLPLHGHY